MILYYDGSNSTVVIDYKGCDHDTQYEGMCVMCCKSVPMNQESHVMMAHDATSLAVSRTVRYRLTSLLFDPCFHF
jgi:RNA polymerase II subunit A-like phosphatase